MTLSVPPLLAVLVLASTYLPAHAFDPVPYAPPKVGLEIHFDMRDGPGGKRVGEAMHRITGIAGKQVTFLSKSEQLLGKRSFKFSNDIVSQYGIAPRRVTGARSGTVTRADWQALDGFWPLLKDRTVYLSFQIFRSHGGKRPDSKAYLTGRSSFTAIRTEKIDILGEEHEAIVLRRETVDEIVRAKKPIKRRIRYLIWWSLKVNWMVRMELSGTSGGTTYRRVVSVTKLVKP